MVWMQSRRIAWRPEIRPLVVGVGALVTMVVVVQLARDEAIAVTETGGEVFAGLGMAVPFVGAALGSWVSADLANGQVASELLYEPRRVRTGLSRILATVVMGTVLCTLLAGVVLVALAVASLVQGSWTSAGDGPAVLLGHAIRVGLAGGLAAGLSGAFALLRVPVGAVASGLVLLYLFGDRLVGAVVPWGDAVSPASTLVRAGAGRETFFEIGVTTVDAFALVIAWVAALTAAALVALRRRDLT